MSDSIWVAFDTETTGLEAGSRLLELAAIVFTDSGEILKTFDSLVNPQMPVPQDVVGVHSIDDSLLVNQPTAKQVLQHFLSWLPRTATLVAHNATFDCNILGWELERARIQWPTVNVIDSARLARGLGETYNNRLQTLVKYHRWQLNGPAHRAMPDADAVHRIVLRALSKNLQHSKANLFKAKPFAGTWHYPRLVPSNVHRFVKAIESGERCYMEYSDGNDRHSSRWITPFGIARAKKTLKLHGWCHSRNGRRTFLADRVLGPKWE